MLPRCILSETGADMRRLPRSVSARDFDGDHRRRQSGGDLSVYQMKFMNCENAQIKPVEAFQIIDARGKIAGYAVEGAGAGKIFIVYGLAQDGNRLDYLDITDEPREFAQILDKKVGA